MEITITSTDQFVELDGVPCRVWRGVSARGTACTVFIHRIACSSLDFTAEFDRELREQPLPGKIVPIQTSNTNRNLWIGQ